jgi:hypothetical protein
MPELEVLRNQLYNGRLFDRNKSMTILARQRGITIDKICGFLGISISTYKDYKLAFSKGGSQALFSRKPKIKKSDDEALKSEIFKVLHQPPSTYGINRTSWTMRLCLEEFFGRMERVRARRLLEVSLGPLGIAGARRA